MYETELKTNPEVSQNSDQEQDLLEEQRTVVTVEMDDPKNYPCHDS